MSFKILVIGGTGYIGSHMVKYLARKGCSVTVLDDLSSGHLDSVLYGDFIQGDYGDRSMIGSVLSRGVDAVMNFASHASVGQSVIRPDIYYKNNFVNMCVLLDAMRDNGVTKLIYSSSAAVFGDPHFLPINEEHPRSPINPYGWTKMMAEQLLADYGKAYGLASVCLRYFNAAGADPEGELGERHEPETHLIPLILQTASGRRENFTIYGSDYDTPDGTCVRDYVHVHDLCSAHWLALQSVINGYGGQAYNLGNSRGFSVQEVVEAAEMVTGRQIPVFLAERRFGDPKVLVADSTLAREQLGWVPAYPDLVTIIRHAWYCETRAAS